MNLKIDVHKEIAKKLDMQNLRNPLEDHLILVDMWADVIGVKVIWDIGSILIKK